MPLTISRRYIFRTSTFVSYTRKVAFTRNVAFCVDDTNVPSDVVGEAWLGAPHSHVAAGEQGDGRADGKN